MVNYPENTRPFRPEDIVSSQRPQLKGEIPRWITRIRFLFYRLVRPFVMAEINNSIWEDKQTD